MSQPLLRYAAAALAIALLLVAGWSAVSLAAEPAAAEGASFPRSLDSYDDGAASGIGEALSARIRQEPFNLVATLIFFCAIVHTFLAGRFMALAHRWEKAHEDRIRRGLADRISVHYGAEVFHFLGEVEVVFGLWAAALVAAITAFFGWSTTVDYLSHKVNFVEAMFVVVIMTLAATRPVLKLAEFIMGRIAALLGGSLTAWWLTILTVGPILGSLITEPAAMTICALLLGRKFFELGPGTKFKYATLGLLFVNVSVGGTLTHFAAPPVLMVAAPWGWGTVHMLTHFGWKALLGILAANGLYFFLFRKEMAGLAHAFAVQEAKERIRVDLFRRKEFEAEIERIGADVAERLGFRENVRESIEELVGRVKKRLEAEYLPEMLKKGRDPELVREAFDKRFEEIALGRLRQYFPGVLAEDERPPYIDPDWDRRDDPVPAWVIAVHVLFMAWTIFNAHHPALFISGLLFFLGFAEVSAPYQNRIDLKPPLLVGFFLGGLVIHGGVQGWWIGPVLGKLTEAPLMAGATILTAFNDNAAITYLSTLVPGFTAGLKYAVVAGAVAGGGLTVIANAPNPAGQSLLKKYFDNAVSPVGLLLGALLPTAVVWACFFLFR